MQFSAKILPNNRILTQTHGLAPRLGNPGPPNCIEKHFLYCFPQNAIHHRKIPRYSKINAIILLYLIFIRRPGGGESFVDIWQICYTIQYQICINKFQTRPPNQFFFIFMKFSGKFGKIIDWRHSLREILDPPLTSVTCKRNKSCHISTLMMKVHPKAWMVLCSKLI